MEETKIEQSVETPAEAEAPATEAPTAETAAPAAEPATAEAAPEAPTAEALAPEATPATEAPAATPAPEKPVSKRLPEASGQTMEDFSKELEESYKLLDNDDVAQSRTEEDEAKALQWAEFQRMMDEKVPVEVKIKEAVPKGAVAYLDGVRAFIPVSKLTIGYVKDTEEWVGKRVHAHIITVEKEKERLVLSARSVEEQEREKSRKERMKDLKVGDVLTGKVETIQDYGAFVDLGGVTGLVHVSEVCGRRISTPREVLKEGQEVTVKVLKLEGKRISLSIKALGDFGGDGPAPSAKDYSDGRSVGTSLGSLLKGIHI